jgi:hypothetical protein
MGKKDEKKVTPENEVIESEQTTEKEPSEYQLLVERIKELENQIIDTKKADIAATNKDEGKQKKEAQRTFLEEKIPFRAFKDNDKYKDDISVQVNGKIWQIKRGVTVYIPRYIYLTLEQAERQLAEAATLEARLVEEFEGKRGILT